MASNVSQPDVNNPFLGKLPKVLPSCTKATDTHKKNIYKMEKHSRSSQTKPNTASILTWNFCYEEMHGHLNITLNSWTQLWTCVNSERCSDSNRARMNSCLCPVQGEHQGKKIQEKLLQQHQVLWKASHCPSKLTEKYLTPTESWRRRSKDTAQLATLLSRSRRQLCTLGRLALLLRLFSLMQSFNSVLFSSGNKGK